LIQLKNITKSFKGFKAIDNLSLTIEKGEYLALLGPNGAGKTTLVEMIEGLQFPDKGEITIDGLTWKGDDKQLRSLIGLSLQETKFVDKLTVQETLELFGSFYDLSKARAAEIMHVVNLDAKRKTYTVNLSGGQQQKLALGVALLNNPQLLLLDEPTTGLDPNARREIWDILLQLKKEKGTTLILTTHYMEEAEQLCDRIVIIDSGKILGDGTLQSLLANFSKGEIISFQVDGNLDQKSITQIKGVQELVWVDAEGKGKLIVDDITQSLPVFLEVVKSQNVELRELGLRKKTLDDLFVAMTGRRLNE
jgi:ABC-2 type transport system ATP-binding protein